MDKKLIEETLVDRKKILEEARQHNNETEELDTGPYVEVEFEKEIRQIELEIDDLDSKLKNL